MAAKMATVSKSRVLVTYSVPLVGFGIISQVHAGSKKLHPRELDIYREPEEPVRKFVEAEPTALETKVSKARKFVWGFADDVKSAVGKVKSVYTTTETTSKEFLQLIQTDRTFQVKVGVISAAVLSGAMLAGRGRRRFRRLFYMAGLGTIATAACYPKCAASVTLNGYMSIKTFVSEQWSKYSEKKSAKRPGELLNEGEVEVGSSPSKTASEEKTYKEVVPSEREELIAEETVEQSEHIKSDTAKDSTEQSLWNKIPLLGHFFGDKKLEEEKEIKGKNEGESSGSTKAGSTDADSTTEKGDAVPVIEGDHGQSNPDDKDMYSTRS